MLRMSRMKDLSAQHPVRVEDRLAIQTGHSAPLRVFPKGLVVSPVVIRSEVRQRAVRLVAFREAIPSVAVSLVVAEALTEEAEAFMEVEASTVVAAIDK